MAKQQKDKGITKDRLVGMKIIDSNGDLVGIVKDIGFMIGKVGISISMEDNNGETKEIPWEEVQAAGDFVLLKPHVEAAASASAAPASAAPASAAPQQTAPRCPTCGGPLSYIQQYQRWYCYKDQKYV
jgi:sporulation protein YlmC with PRC-barrel domain